MEMWEHIKRDTEAVVCFLLRRAGSFGVREWTALKLFLLSAGVLMGLRFAKFFRGLKPILTVVMLISGIFTFAKVFAPAFERRR